MIGQTLGSYRILQKLGAGGVFNIHKAYDPDADRYVVIQLMRQELASDARVRVMYIAYLEETRKLDHPNIPPLLELNEDYDLVYAVYPFLEGASLESRIQRGPLPLDEASSILSQIAGALDHAHSLGILHRDLAPANVQIDPAGKAYLIDWGRAAIRDATPELRTLVGTPVYLAPEEWAFEAPITGAADVYSLGVVLYEMVTGRVPFEGKEPMALMMKKLQDAIALPSTLRPDLPQAAERVFLKALATDPRDRYQTAGAMAEAFADAMAATRQRPPLLTLLTDRLQLGRKQQTEGVRKRARSFDVFLSHNSKDKPSVKRLGEALKERGISVWLDEWELAPGRTWLDDLEQIVTTCKSAVVCVGQNGIGPWEEPEMQALLRRFVNEKRSGYLLPVIPVLLPGAPMDVKLPLFLEAFTWVDLRGGLRREGLDRLEWGITGRRPNA